VLPDRLAASPGRKTSQDFSVFSPVSCWPAILRPPAARSRKTSSSFRLAAGLGIMSRPCSGEPSIRRAAIR